MIAVIDRFEGDQGVLLVGDEERQVVVARSLLPKRAKEGDWLSIEFDEAGAVVSAKKDAAATTAARERIAKKMQDLLNRPQQ